jgi:hypothetical protein
LLYPQQVVLQLYRAFYTLVSPCLRPPVSSSPESRHRRISCEWLVSLWADITH